MSFGQGVTIRSHTIRGVRVPLNFALGTSAAVVRSVPLVLLDLETSDGITGRSYVFCYTAAGARSVAAVIGEAIGLAGDGPVTPLDLWRVVARRLELLGVTGIVRFALSAIDIALWDAAAIAAGMPLATMLGASPRTIPAYDSRGLGLMEPARLAAETDKLLAGGLRAVKLRLGYPTLRQDLDAVAAVRSRLPADVALMVDFNQALSPTEAMQRCAALDAENLAWIEEPIRHDDYHSCAQLAERLGTPVQIGENFNGPAAMLESLRSGAADLAMPDVARIGGVTGWMQAAGIAAAASVPLSSHLMPEISIHLLAASPTAHMLEYVDWANAFVEEPLAIGPDGVAVPDRPGLGLSWDSDRLKRLDTI